MKSQQYKILSNISFLLLGSVFVILPTASTNTGMTNTFSFYPDLLLCFIFSTVFNRPKTLSLLSILLLSLFSDVLQMKPIGLFTMITLIVYLVVKSYGKEIVKSSFYLQYIIFLFVVASIQIMNLAVHYLLFIPIPNFLLVLNQTIFTFVCYPLFDIPYKLLRSNER